MRHRDRRVAEARVRLGPGPQCVVVTSRMIIEGLVWATQRAARGARHAGIAAEQAAIVARALRCRQAWAPHLARCRGFVAAAAGRCEGRGRVVVLGSGALLDIPLAALSRGFAEVVLVDAAQPLHARLLARRLGNVVVRTLSLVELGSAPPAYRSWRDAVPDADLVVASMLLSQLAPPRAAAPGEAWRRALVAAALEDLGRGGEATCLVTETARLVSGPGAAPRVEDPLHGIAPPPALEEWEWHMAPPGELGDGTQVVLRVAASFRPAGRRDWLQPAQPLAAASCARVGRGI